MAARLSTRISIRWGTDAPSEPTETVVLSIGSYFMDLRATTADKRIDWAFAGTREVLSQDPLACRWHHIIDSRGSSAPDEGSFETLPNGDSLERGAMPCPEKGGAVTPYEEVWREVPPPAGPRGGWILQGAVSAAGSSGTDATVFLGRLGGLFLAMAQDGEGRFGVGKEELEGAGNSAALWKVRYKGGDIGVPSMGELGTAAFEGSHKWELGETVIINGKSYTVRAISKEG